MNVFGIGLPEMALIMVIALLIFGPKKLPEIGRSMGKAIRGFQDASKEFESEFKRQAELIENDKPLEATLEPPAAKETPQLAQAEPEVESKTQNEEANTPSSVATEEVTS
jgi:sec-independent protein translocase protein TatA